MKLNKGLDKLNEAMVEAKVTGNLNLNKISEAASITAEASGKEFHLTPSITVDDMLSEKCDSKAYYILDEFKNELFEKMADKVISIDEYNYLNVVILPGAIFVGSKTETAKLTVKKFFLDLDLDEEIDKIKSEKYLQTVKSKMGNKYYNGFINEVIPEINSIIE